jgi:hypothetical protein
VGQLGANAHGEVLEPGRVPDCYLALQLHASGNKEAGVLVVAPAALLHPSVPQPDGTVLYELVTGHPDRTAHELVFLADLTVELRAWPTDTWTKVGVDSQAAARAVVTGWQRGDLPGLRLGGLTTEEALALARPAMTYVRAQLGDRFQRQVARADRQWRQSSSPPAGRPLPVAADTRRLRQHPRRTPTVRTPTVRTVTAVPEAAADSHGVRGVRCAATQTAAAVSGCPAGSGGTATDPQPPFRHHGCAAQVALAHLRWPIGSVDT